MNIDDREQYGHVKSSLRSNTGVLNLKTNAAHSYAQRTNALSLALTLPERNQ